MEELPGLETLCLELLVSAVTSSARKRSCVGPETADALKGLLATLALHI